MFNLIFVALEVFPIEPLEQFEGCTPVYQQPVELFCFSYDEHRGLRYDASSLKYYYPAVLGADLSQGFEERIERDETIDEHLDGFLLSLCAYERIHGRTRTSVDILTWRGILARFLCTPYDRRTSWSVHLMRFQDTLFIEDCHVSPLPLTTREALMSLSTLPDTWDKCSREQIERRYDTVVNNNVQYCAAVRTKLDGITLLIAGEVDCTWDAKPSPPENPVPLYVELKTAFANRAVFERNKLFKTWAQSYLLGVPRVIVGFRTEDGLLAEVKTYETHALLSHVRRSRDGLRALAWTAALLRFLRKNCTDDVLAKTLPVENQLDISSNINEVNTEKIKETIIDNISKTAIPTDNTDIVSSATSVTSATASSLALVWRLSYTSGDTVVRLERVKTQCFLHPYFISHRTQTNNRIVEKDIIAIADAVNI
ncbi:hypothetical protein PMAC_001566 [Pneumocystis sp. 'macacae']|nr:hypothetical protein PMAC_001566 [Pneumocystis sp. 'macacae']